MSGKRKTDDADSEEMAIQKQMVAWIDHMSHGAINRSNHDAVFQGGNVLMTGGAMDACASRLFFFSGTAKMISPLPGPWDMDSSRV